MKVIINSTLSSAHVEQIRIASGDAQLVAPTDRATLLREIADAEVLFGGFSRELFEAGRRLKWVQVPSAGVDGLLFPEFVESDILLTSAKGFVGPHLADHTWALILALARGIGRAVRERAWSSSGSIREESVELEGTTLGVVGFGGTGRAVAKRAQGFDMRVLAVDPEEVESSPYVHTVWKMSRFYDLLAESDIVSVCAPLTPETHGLFDDEAFRRMKRNALLVNVTRGKIVNGDSLLRALRDGLLRGAGLDVTPEEPLPLDSPLWDMPNVVITPHVAGGSPIRLDRMVGLFCENLERFLAGKPLLSVIDKTKGY